MQMVIPRWGNLQQMAAPKRFVSLEQPKRHRPYYPTLNTILHTETTPTLHCHTTNKLQSWTNETRYIPPLQIILLCHIHINECNPKNDIAYTQNTIQTQHRVSHMYDNTGHHLITIPEQRLKWLWEQYQTTSEKPQHLEPPIQPFETEVAWLYQWYKYRTSKNYPLKLSQYTLPEAILEYLIDSYQITHS